MTRLLMEHLFVTGKLIRAVAVGLVATLAEGIDLDFVITKVLPVILTLGAGYVLLFADSRYVRKSFFYMQKDRIDSISTDIAVMKEQGRTNKESLERIEKHLQELRNRP